MPSLYDTTVNNGVSYIGDTITHSVAYYLNLLYFPTLLTTLLAVAILLDHLFGEPKRLHPLVAFGRWAKTVELSINRHNTPPILSKLAGIFALIITLSPIFLVIAAFYILADWSIFAWLGGQVFVLYLCLGWKSLKQHVQAIQTAYKFIGLPSARAKLSLIVSRDTQQLSETEVAQAGIESLLENSCDALYATLFWFLLGGAELALLHRWVNTLDAMWGYKNNRFKHFGWAAAKLDDLLAYAPARLTALCFILASKQNKRQALHCWRRQAKQCSSPNGGVVMTTGAGALNITLSNRAFYHGKWKTKPTMGRGQAATMTHITPAIQLVTRSLTVFFTLMVFALLTLLVWCLLFSPHLE